MQPPTIQHYGLVKIIQKIILITAGCLLLASTSQARASMEAGEGAGFAFDLDTLQDRAETLFNTLTETPSTTDMTTAQQNIAAFLGMIREAEGTANSADPYAVCYAYRHTIRNFANHPAITGEWKGERLSDAMCRNAGFGPGCISSAAGAYQIIKPTWINVAKALGLPDFELSSQDAAAVELIRRRGALEDVKAGRIASAINKCRNEWASLPGNFAKQGQRSQGDLITWYMQNGGTTA
jgi:muramidase (phage lysozyme)